MLDQFIRASLAEDIQDGDHSSLACVPAAARSSAVLLIKESGILAGMEVAERICSKKGSKVYGILSVLAQAFYDCEYLFTVPPSVFNPPPKVDSGVMRMIRKKDFILDCNEKLLFTVVKTAFNQRRKTLRNSLKSLNLSEKLQEDSIFALRPEQLAVEDFIHLTQKIAADGI